MFSVKIHKVDSEVLLACCDRELLGAELTDGELSLKMSEGFYGGEIVDDKTLADLLKNSTSANIFGDKAVGVAVSKGYVSESSVLSFSGVKHAQLYVI
jgi:hypothetical protein